MGTNYYAIPKVSECDKKEIIEEINKGRWDNVRRMMPKVVHLGKSSGGWKFMFNHNNWNYFEKSFESMKYFIDNSEIEDEYGNKITPEDFWKLVEFKKDGIDNKEYYKRHASFLNMATKNYHQEDHFGLFFSDSTDFS